MNLNQAAHGDREFGFICTRLRLSRKVVVGHWQDADVQARARDVDARRVRPGPTAQGAKVARFGDNMREVAVTEGDKVEAQLRFGYSVNGYGVGDLVAARQRGDRRRRRRARARSTATSTHVAAALRRAARSAKPARAARASSSACARFLEDGRLQGLHHHLRGPARPRAAARPGRPAPDGRRLRLRRRGRLEDRRPGARDEGHGRRPARRHVVHGGLHLPPRPERRRRCSARTCSRSAPRSPPASPRSRSIRSASAARPTRPGSSSTRRPARRSTPRSSTWATASA